MEGPDNLTIIGRSEQFDAANTMSSTGTYGCSCQDSYADSWIEHQLPNGTWGTPWNSPPVELFVGDTIQLRARQLDHDCFWNYGEPHAPSWGAGWGSSTIAADDPNGLSVMVVNENGLATAQAAGTSRVGADWFVVRWMDLYECCEYQPDEAQPIDDMVVKPAVGSLKASIPSTKNAANGNRPAAGVISTVNPSAAFATTSTTDLMVVFQSSDPPITVTAEDTKPNAGSRLRWKIERDPTDTVATGTPTLSAQTGTQITVTPNVAGNFRLMRYYDANNNGSYDAGEHQKVLLMAVVRATVNSNQSSIDSPNATFIAGQNSVTTSLIMVVTCVVTLEGGGANKLIGVSKITIGDVGNLTNDTSVINYPVPVPTPPAPGNVAGTESEKPGPGSNVLPMVDTGNVNAGQEPTGGNTPFRISNNDPGTGAQRTVTADDDPGFGPWDLLHPTTRNLWATTQGGYNFREFIVGYSSSFPRYYVVLAKGDWTITGVGSNAGGGQWTNSNSSVTVGGGSGTSASLTITITNGSPQSGDAASVQVLGLSYVNEHFYAHSP